MIYYGYDGGSKLTSYVTMRGVHNHPQRFVKSFREGLNRLCKYLRWGFITAPKVCSK